METVVLMEGVLNDDVIHYPPKGKVFSGNYIAIVERYEYANSWSDAKVIKRFRDENQLEKYLNKFYPNY